VKLWSKQEEVLGSLVEPRRVAVKSGNGLGKGFCAAVALLWFAVSGLVEWRSWQGTSRPDDCGPQRI